MTYPPATVLCRVGYLLICNLLLCLPIYTQLTKVEKEISSNVPLEISIAKQESENWAHEIEIEVKNTSQKPIYFLYLILSLEPKKPSPKEARLGFPFIFGSPRLYSEFEAPNQDDPFIPPGEAHVFKLSESTADSWKKRVASGQAINKRVAFLRLGWLYYGDQTGFTGGSVPFKKNK